MQARSPRLPSDLGGPGGAGPCPHSGVPAPTAKAGSPHLPFLSAPRASSRYRRQYLGRVKIGDAPGVLELLWLVLTAVLAWLRPRQDLVLENLLLRHQLAVLTRPTRTRPRARLRLWDKLLWVLARRWCARWRDHLSIVTPDTLVRWHRKGWRLFWRGK